MTLLCLFFLVLAAAVLLQFADTSINHPALRVGTFNIRNADAQDDQNSWPLRRAGLVEIVRQKNPDVIGFQEVLPVQQADLVADLPDYESVATHREDGVGQGEAASLFFRRDRFEKRDAGTFWLAPQTDRPGPPAWDAACTRICTWAVLFDRVARRSFVVFNTHFDHVGELAKAESARLIVRQMARQNHPFLLMGDFNSTEDEAIYATLLAAAKDAGRPLVDSYRAVHPMPQADEASFHGFTEQTAGRRIDWILHDNGFQSITSTIGPRKSDGRFASDHAPVWASLNYAT